MSSVEETLGDREPVVSDQRLEKVGYKLRSRYGFRKLEGTVFVTWIEPSTQLRKGDRLIDAPPRAIFAAISRNPRAGLYAAGAPEFIADHGTTWLQDFRDAESEFGHYVGRVDPLFEIYKAVVTAHLNTLKNLKELI